VIYSYLADRAVGLAAADQGGQPAGVISSRGTFQRSPDRVGDPKLRQAQRQSPVSAPLLLMTDQEGGPVLAARPAPRDVAEAGRRVYTRPKASSAGPGAGKNLFAGMNVNLAPVLDVLQVRQLHRRVPCSYSSRASTVSNT
jgi:beta-N-acetylhexosaminidase